MSLKMLVLLVVVMCLMVFPAQAQENELDVSFGSVVRVAADQIVILEYDFEEEAEKEAVYFMSDETQYENIASLAELELGDYVEIVYSNEAGKKTVVTVKKEILLEEDGDVEEGEDLPEPASEYESDDT